MVISKHLISGLTLCVLGASLLLDAGACFGQPTSRPLTEGEDLVNQIKQEYEPRWRAAKTPEERDRIESEMWDKLFKEAARRSAGMTVGLKGNIVDESGQRLDGVTIDVTTYPEAEGTGQGFQHQVVMANGQFDCSYRIAHVELRFKKEGYYGVEIHLNDDVRTNKHELARLGREGTVMPGPNGGSVRVVMEKMGKTTKLQGFSGFFAHDNWETTVVDFTKKPAMARDVAHLPQIKDIKDVPLNCAVAMLERDSNTGTILTRPIPEDYSHRETIAAVRLYLNAPGRGFALYASECPARGFREMKEAPETGYKPELAVSDKALDALTKIGAGSHDPEHYVYFFFKTADGKYGKGAIYAADAPNKRDRVALIGVSLYVQPDGTRNLEDPHATPD